MTNQFTLYQVSVLGSLFLCLGAAVPPTSSKAYVGKLPWAVVGGYSFNRNPAVRRMVFAATVSDLITRAVLTDGVSSEITRSGALIITSSCEPHNCSDHNWTIAVLEPSGPAAVCYHDSSLMDASGRWFVGGQAMYKTSDGCGSKVPPMIAAAIVTGE